MPAEHAWSLCNHAGNAVAELVTASGRTITYTRNSYASAELTISHHDAAADAFFTALAAGWPQLKVWRRAESASSSTLIFRGWLAPFTEALEESALITLSFRSPFARLLGESPERGRETSETFTAEDAGTIATSLIDAANTDGTTGLATTGVVQTTVDRDRTYQRANVGEAIQNLTRVIDGGDFSETFLTGTDLAEFNWYGTLGDDKPSVRFEYGEDTLNNVRSVARTTQPPINRATVLGANGLVGTAENTASIAAYGLWPVQVSQSDVVEQTTLDEKAEALLRPTPVKTVAWVPEYGLANCPKPIDDFFIGDSGRLFGHRGAFTEDVTMRVNSMTIAVDENGREAAEIADPQGTEDDVLESSIDTEVVTDG